LVGVEVKRSLRKELAALTRKKRNASAVAAAPSAKSIVITESASPSPSSNEAGASGVARAMREQQREQQKRQRSRGAPPTLLDTHHYPVAYPMPYASMPHMGYVPPHVPPFPPHQYHAHHQPHHLHHLHHQDYPPQATTYYPPPPVPAHFAMNSFDHNTVARHPGPTDFAQSLQRPRMQPQQSKPGEAGDRKEGGNFA
ncbi:hypothetical protein TeGR_g4442, partial [Tetraparma gracilis]